MPDVWIKSITRMWRKLFWRYERSRKQSSMERLHAPLPKVDIILAGKRTAEINIQDDDTTRTELWDGFFFNGRGIWSVYYYDASAW